MTNPSPAPHVFGGLCGRIAERYAFDARLVRTLTVLLTITTAGVAALVYAIVWFATPGLTAYASSGDGAASASAASISAASAPAAGPPRAVELYGPVSRDLDGVDAMLSSLTEVEHPWLRRMLESTLTGSGKRLRPAIAMLAGRFGDYDPAAVTPLAASVELLHTATLVHDDVIDAAPERRGRPTAAALFNNGPTVMLGDYMFAHAAEVRGAHGQRARDSHLRRHAGNDGSGRAHTGHVDVRVLGGRAALPQPHLRQDGIALRHGRRGWRDRMRRPGAMRCAAAALRREPGDGVPDRG